MNNQRRNRIRKMISELSVISNEIEDVLNEEEIALDGIPESMQDTERYYNSENSAESLDEALSFVNDTIKSLQEAL